MNADGDDPVGYGSPPPEHRFQKGESGNPRGRPRRKVVRPPVVRIIPHREIFLEEARRVVPVPGSDGQEFTTVGALAVRKLRNLALSGDARALERFLKRVEAAEDERADRDRMAQEAFDYKEHWYQVFANAERRGAPHPYALPHPDDIEITASCEVIFHGPIAPEQKKIFAAWEILADEIVQELNEIIARGEPVGEAVDHLKDKQQQLSYCNKKLPPSLRREWLPPPRIASGADATKKIRERDKIVEEIRYMTRKELPEIPDPERFLDLMKKLRRLNSELPPKHRYVPPL